MHEYDNFKILSQVTLPCVNKKHLSGFFLSDLLCGLIDLRVEIPYLV